uniref:Ovule protein n=1 Tax=Elaeophora elaphi TaxID=1147741 RepID=A0A0R3S704_9BILA
MESATAIALFYMVKARGFPQKYRLRQWQLSLHHLSETGNYSDLFVFYIYGDQVNSVRVSIIITSAYMYVS